MKCSQDNCPELATNKIYHNEKQVVFYCPSHLMTYISIMEACGESELEIFDVEE